MAETVPDAPAPEGLPRGLARSEARREALLAEVPRWYSGTLHLVWIHLSALGAIAASLWALRDPQPWEWALIPVFLVVANTFEWWVHRGPLHHPYPGLRLLYERHAKRHHVFFTDETMALRAPRELALLLFPPYMIPAMVILLSPLCVALGALHWNLAWLFLASAFAYYLLYEWLHLLHHVPPDSFFGRRSFVARLRLHHWRHHDPKRMLAGNFNVSFPLADWLLGTTLAAEPDDEASTSADPPES